MKGLLRHVCLSVLASILLGSTQNLLTHGQQNKDNVLVGKKSNYIVDTYKFRIKYMCVE